MSLTELGSLLREARQERRLSLRDVERSTKNRISNAQLSLLESGSIRQPSPHHLHLLAEVLGLDYSRLMRLAGYALPGELKRVREGTAATPDIADFSTQERMELENYVKYIRSKRKA